MKTFDAMDAAQCAAAAQQRADVNAPASPPPSFPDASDAVTIRGTRIVLSQLLDRRLYDQAYVQELRARLQRAEPFPHLVLDGLFDPSLLELVAEEFTLHSEGGWKDVRSSYERTRRSVLAPRLGAASQLYFGVLASGWFTKFLADLSGVDYLIPDPKLFGGGLHESRDGARFDVHRDFNLHPCTSLRNEMVFITYLNKGWQAEWGAALELWDGEGLRCVSKVQPEFGRSVLLLHGPRSFHGHPTPMRTPDGRARRSVAAYYYSSPQVRELVTEDVVSRFLFLRRLDKAKRVVQMVTPPILWSMARKIRRKGATAL